MLYRLFLYKIGALSGSAPIITFINKSIQSGFEQESDMVVNGLSFFDVDSVRQEIERELQGKCKVYVEYPVKKDGRKPYICIVTSYDVAKEVVIKLHEIAANNELVLYDAEQKKSFYKDLIDDTFILFKQRVQKIKIGIRNNISLIYKLQEIFLCEDESERSCVYVLTLKKMKNVSFEERVLQFYEYLQGVLENGERLECKNKMFVIIGAGYTITLILEAYKKNPNMIGYVKNGEAKVDLLHRMGCVVAFDWMKQCSEREISDIYSRLRFLEMEDRYDNIGERFIKSVLITKMQRKEVFDVRYSGLGCYGSEIIFHIVPSEYTDEKETISVLKIEEESASFILPFVIDVYPYFYDHYYLAENYMPIEMLFKIIKRIKFAKEMVINDTFNPVLDKYIERFNLYVLSNYSLDERSSENEDRDQIIHNPRQFVFDHRYEIAHLYDIFIEWAELQIDYYGDEDRMFNVQGP